MPRILVIPVDGDMEYCDVANDDIESLQAIVGGYIEPLYLSEPNAVMYVNEEGRGLGLRINVRATFIAYEYGHLRSPNLPLVGDVFISGPVFTDVPTVWLEEK